MTILPFLAAALLAVMLAGLVRIAAGPTDADRMLAAQLMGTSAVALVIVLGAAMGQPALFDVALVFAVLAAVALICFVAAGRGGSRR